MNLNIAFPRNLVTELLLKQERIPCLCKISKDFEIYFPDAVMELSGLVSGWDRKELELRALAGGGGKYTHYACGMVTLKEVGECVYKIIDLEMFYNEFGWCTVCKGGEYAPPRDFSLV